MHKLLAILLAFFVASPIAAQTTLLAFPDPAIIYYRAVTATLNYSGGVQPSFRVACDCHAGDQVRWTGHVNLSSGSLRIAGCGTPGNLFSGDTDVDDTVTCAASSSALLIISPDGAVGSVSAVTITITPSQ